MKRALPIIVGVLTIVFIAAGSLRSSGLAPATTAEGAVQLLFDHVRNHDYPGAYSYISNGAAVSQNDFVRDVAGSEGSLRSTASVQKTETKVLNENGQQAMVRTTVYYSTAVGGLTNTRDLQVLKEGSNWKVVWAVEKQPNVPPQVVPVTYLRWDVIRSGSGDDDFGGQNAEPPRVRIISMNAIEKDGSLIILGEIVNEDTVPGFISVSATLVAKDGKDMAEESSFDKISHTLLPREVSPFRIDFPNQRLANIKNVRLTPNSLLVPASADPVIGVIDQRLEKDARGKTVLRGELMNQSGIATNIPHVLATFYDNSGKVIWVSDGYVDRALVPQTPIPFAVEVRDDLAASVQSYRVTVNHYSREESF